MAKFAMEINGTDVGAAEGQTAWAGDLPPTGVYSGVLKVLKMDVIGENAKPENRGKPKMIVGIELRGTPNKEFDGYVAFGNQNLIESSIPYVNQFLLALTDGSDDQFEKIKVAFYKTGLTTDERKKHVLKIGKWAIDSPKGELPMTVSLKKSGRWDDKLNKSVERIEIVSYLVSEGATRKSGPTTPEAPVEEEATVDLEPEEEDYEEDAEDAGEDADESLLDA